MNKTDQQQKIIESFSRGESFAIRAGAGTGKTTTLVECFNAHKPKDALAAAFGKDIAKELKARLPEDVTCKTLNSLGHTAWNRHLGRRAEVNARKNWDIFNTYPHKDKLYDRASDIVNLVRVAKTSGLKSGFNADKPDVHAWRNLAFYHDIDDPDELFEHAAFLLRESAKQSFEGVIDFDDQLYMPILYGSPFQKYSCVAVDEGQDLSDLQHQIIKRSLAKQGQIMIAGDRNQAIYAFRGADENSFDALISMFSLSEFPLMKSFRCPIRVVEEANKYVPDLEAASSTLGEIKIIRHYPIIAENKTILSRFNSNLVTLAFKALRQGIGINYLGRDFLSGLKSLYKKYPTVADLENWRKTQLDKVKSPSAKTRIEDRFLTLVLVLSEAGRQNVKVEVILDQLNFSKKNGGFTLSTIHKAKGLEWNNVTYFDYFSEMEGNQENNIKYVGVTRSKHTLELHEE